jgi:molybdopterin converting factor small subunit
MARIKLKVVGSTKVAILLEGDTINAENLLQIVQRQRLLDNYEFGYFVFLNGKSASDGSKGLNDGDEVILIPIATGG